MRELLLAFVIAVVIGSIINGWPQPKTAQPDSGATSPLSANPSSGNPNTGAHRDFPDFASFASVDNTNFDSLVLKSEKPVFIDCYVPNNSACEQMLPLVAAVAKTHEESVIMAKLNVMDNLVLAHRYGVGTVPSFLLFNKGALVSKLNGVLPQERLESMIATVFQSASSALP